MGLHWRQAWTFTVVWKLSASWSLYYNHLESASTWKTTVLLKLPSVFSADPVSCPVLCAFWHLASFWFAFSKSSLYTTCLCQGLRASRFHASFCHCIFIIFCDIRPSLRHHVIFKVLPDQFTRHPPRRAWFVLSRLETVCKIKLQALQRMIAIFKVKTEQQYQALHKMHHSSI